MRLQYNYRLYPAPGQHTALAKAFGCARVVFNDALAARETAHQAGDPHPTDAQLSARLTAAKATPERTWLNEVSSVVLQQALADLNTAYRNFFASLHGTRKGPKMGKPTRSHTRKRCDRRESPP
jgi:putative transposase